jgi:sugar phosphate isomerase/epimerase
MYYSVCITNSAPDGYPAPLRGEKTTEDILLAKQIGFPAVQIHCAWPWDLDWENIAAFLKKEDMGIDCIGTGLSAGRHNINFCSEDPYIAKKSMEVIRAFIDAGKTTGATVIIGSMKGNQLPGRSIKQTLDRVYECLMPVVEYAEKQGVDMVLEAINRYETKLLNTAADTLEMVNRVNSDRLKVHLDTFHMNIEEQDMCASIRMCKDELGHIHFADSDRWYPGHGHIDFKAVIDTLYDIGYEGGIGFEHLPHPQGFEAAKKGYENTIGYLR